MATHFRAKLLLTDTEGVAAIAFTLQEGYNTGWGGTARVIGSVDTGTMDAGKIFTALMASGYYAGRSVTFALSAVVTHEDDATQHTATIVRKWPCVITNSHPFDIDDTHAGCDFDLVDPISYFAQQPVWGAYRNTSPEEIVGGVISLAAGGPGKPTITQALETLGKVDVRGAYREEIAQIPYAIAAGETMGEWLSEFVALLGLRAELDLGTDQQGVLLTLTDLPASGTALTMDVIDRSDFTEEPDGDPDTTVGSEQESDSHGKIFIAAHAAFPGIPARAGLLDNPNLGTGRVVYARGPIGYVINTPGVDTIEAARRVHRSIRGTGAEMLILGGVTGQPAIRPGQRIELDPQMHGIAMWQCAGLVHTLTKERYYNEVKLLRGDLTWYPELPLYHGPRYVSATVDGGDSYEIHEPVPRDDLGQVKIKFPFTPTPMGFDAQMREAADSNYDGAVKLDDFEEDELEGFKDTETWDEEARKLADGELNDPFPGTRDEDLTPEELAQRREAAEKRRDATRYIAYKEFDVAGDRDHDGRITSRDTEISEELSARLETDEGRRRMRELAAPAGDQSSASEDEIPLVEEYKKLFEMAQDNENELSDEMQALRREVADEADKWPPRIPLPIVSPMAGARHGFVTAHRQGDTCKVAVNNPLSAEIIGFQYRADRQINVDVSAALGGLVVEHNYGNAWTGMIFRRKEDVEEEETED